MDFFRSSSLRQALPLRQRAEEEAAHLSFLMAEAEKAVASIFHGEHRQRKAGTGENFWQFREYYSGDRPQDIDWRQSGKTSRIFIRQKEWQTNQSVYLWCSHAPGMDFQSQEKSFSKSDSAKIITLALALLLTHAGEEVGMLNSVRKGRSENALQKITENLIDKGRNKDSLPSGSMPPNSSLFLIGDFLDPPGNIEDRFKDLAARADGGFVIQILDPAEIDLPYEGRIIFESPEGKQRELINNVSSIREEYKQRIRAHIEEVKSICRRCEWHYALHVIDRDIKDTLLEIWLAINLHKQRAGTLQR